MNAPGLQPQTGANFAPPGLGTSQDFEERDRGIKSQWTRCLGRFGVILWLQVASLGALAQTGGTVWDWGLNRNGQLGNGTTVDSPEPVQVLNLTGVVTLAGGCNHSLAIKGDGSLWAWGWNAVGQLGNATTIQAIKTQPKALSPDLPVFPVAVKKGHMALMDAFSHGLRATEVDPHEVSWHTLRHTFASRLVQSGVNLLTVQKLPGHATLTWS